MPAHPAPSNINSLCRYFRGGGYAVSLGPPLCHACLLKEHGVTNQIRCRMSNPKHFRPLECALDMSVSTLTSIDCLIENLYIYLLSASPSPIFGYEESPLDFIQIFWGVLGTMTSCHSFAMVVTGANLGPPNALATDCILLPPARQLTRCCFVKGLSMRCLTVLSSYAV